VLSVLLAVALTALTTRARLRRGESAAELPALVGGTFGIVAVGELLLELPVLTPVWWVVLPATLLVTRLATAAACIDATLAHRPEGLDAPEDYGRVLGRGLLATFVLLLPQFVFLGLVLLLLSERTNPLSYLVLLTAYVAMRTLLWPFLYILAVAPRRPDDEETARIRALSERFGLGVNRVRVIGRDERDANAFLSGVGAGHRIFLGQRLFDLGDDELAAVLAHECAHRDLHHLVRSAVAGLVVTPVVTGAGYVVVATAGSGSWVALLCFLVIGPEVAAALTLALGRSHEYAADRVAADRVGADAMARALERITPRSSGNPHWWQVYRHSHPTLAARIERLRQPAVASASSSSIQA
jgi:Zn-dependent protease with chaperone function